MIEINDPTTASIPQAEPSHPRGGNTTYALILILITQKYTDIDVCKILIQPLFVRHVPSFSSSFFILSHTPFIFFFFGGIFT